MALAFRSSSIGDRLIDPGQCIRDQRKRGDFDAEDNCASGKWFDLSWRTQLAGPVARWRRALGTLLTDSVAGQFTVEGLIVNSFLGRPKDPVFFHAGD